MQLVHRKLKASGHLEAGALPRVCQLPLWVLKNRCRIIFILIVINMGSAKEGLADASAPPRKTKAPPLHP